MKYLSAIGDEYSSVLSKYPNEQMIYTILQRPILAPQRILTTSEMGA